MSRWTLGASRVEALLAGHGTLLWEIATGRKPDSAARDLKPVRWSSGDADEDALRSHLRREFGKELEPLHYRIFEERMRRPLALRQVKVVHPTLPLHATLDGATELEDLPLLRVPTDLKVTSQSSKVPDLARDYQPQLCAQDLCLDDCGTGVLSVMWRTPMWRAFRLTLDELLKEEIRERVSILGWHVARDTPPPDLGVWPLPSPTWEPLAAATADEGVPA